ncbi:hypothetical protein [Prauserella marina]|nr:hypothetical protein [Prauserella marina]
MTAQPVFDKDTTTWWVPVQPDDTRTAPEPHWVPREQIVDVASPS